MKPYYEDSAVTIYHGDCREILPQLPKADLVLTDPPYPNNDRVLWTNLNSLRYEVMGTRGFYFWDAFYPFPLEPTAIHIWHKPNGQSSKQYERIFECYGQQSCKVFRVAAILPNYTQYKDECVNHPTQKPIKLISRLIPKDAQLILDPFCGSGTTLRAAKDLGRKALGIELEEKYCSIAAKRMQQECLPLYSTGQDSVRALFAETASLPLGDNGDTKQQD